MNDDQTDGVREIVEVYPPDRPGGITFTWRIRLVPHESDDAQVLRAKQARAIRGVLESLRNSEGAGDLPPPSPT